MGVEIERKFLVDHQKWDAVAKPAGTHYRQGYILSEEKRTVRVRITDTSGYITFKGASGGISRSEFEYEIPLTDGAALLDGFAETEVEKIRYRITFAEKLWEVDVFSGDNKGLIVAEIELQHEDEEFKLPDWIGPEVSDDARYYNSSLSLFPYKNW